MGTRSYSLIKYTTLAFIRCVVSSQESVFPASLDLVLPGDTPQRLTMWRFPTIFLFAQPFPEAPEPL